MSCTFNVTGHNGKQKHYVSEEVNFFFFFLLSFPNFPNPVPCTVKMGSCEILVCSSITLCYNLQREVRVRNTGQAFGSLSLCHP